MTRRRILRLTQRAEDDLIAIWTYIATHNPRAADQLLDDIDTKARLLSEFPEIGQARPDIAEGLRYLPIGSYLILYRQITQGIEVVRVVHGARRIEDLI